MKPRIIFCSAVCLALIAVVLLALFSPTSHRKRSQNNPKSAGQGLALSLYIQQPHIGMASTMNPSTQPDAGPGAFIFHHILTEGPDNTSRVAGKVQGFIIPIENFANSDFNVIYLSFHTGQYSGSLSVLAKHVSPDKDTQELTVVGGTGSFAFAKGLAVFVQKQSSDVDSSYHVKLHLRFPNHSLTVPG